MAEFETGAVLAAAVDIGGQRDLLVPGADPVIEAEPCGRPFEQLFDRHLFVAGNRHEGGVGAVFQKPAHEIGEQVAITADRRIDAAGDPVVAVEKIVVERLTHAMQPLEFEADAVGAGKLQNGRDG